MSLKNLRITVAIDAAGTSGSKSKGSDYDSEVISVLRDLNAQVDIMRVDTTSQVFHLIEQASPDIVLNLALSTLPKEACFAAVLEYCNIPFTGSGSEGIALCNDKVLMRGVLSSRGIRTPRFYCFEPDQRVDRLPFAGAVLVKPTNLGGSSGLYRNSIVSKASDVGRNVMRIHDRFQVPAMCDEYINGREISVGLLEGRKGRLTFLKPREFLFKTAPGSLRFKTQRVKESSSYRRYCGITNSEAKLSRHLFEEMKYVCGVAFGALKLRGYATVDFRVDKNETLYLLEINANPGLSSANPMWSGVSFPGVVESIVRRALA